MKQLKTPLAFLAAWLSIIPGRSSAIPADSAAISTRLDGLDPVQLRPLNRPGDNLFAGHRSHSSHGSHRSSSGGGFSAPSTPQPPAPQRPQGPANSLYGSGLSQPTDPGRASAVTPMPMPSQTAPSLSMSEKRKLQIMRVQIALTSLGLYEGTVDGILNDVTKASLAMFQNLKGIEPNGLMSTPTLNALGVPTVQ